MSNKTNTITNKRPRNCLTDTDDNGDLDVCNLFASKRKKPRLSFEPLLPFHVNCLPHIFTYLTSEQVLALARTSRSFFYATQQSNLIQQIGLTFTRHCPQYLIEQLLKQHMGHVQYFSYTLSTIIPDWNCGMLQLACTTLKSVKLSKITDMYLAMHVLGACKELEYLEMDSEDVSNSMAISNLAGYAFFKLKTLKWNCLLSNAVKYLFFELQCRAVQLETFDVTLDQEGFMLAPTKKLRHLIVRDMAKVETLSQLLHTVKYLERLHLFNVGLCYDLKQLLDVQLPFLEELIIDETKSCGDASQTPVHYGKQSNEKYMPSLKRVQLNLQTYAAHETSALVERLAGNSLEFAELAIPNCNSLSLAGFICESSNLKHLDFRSKSLLPGFIQIIMHCPGLQALKVEYIPPENGIEIPLSLPAILAIYQCLPKLTTFSCKGLVLKVQAHPGDNFAFFHNLKCLELHNCDINFLQGALDRTPFIRQLTLYMPNCLVSEVLECASGKLATTLQVLNIHAKFAAVSMFSLCYAPSLLGLYLNMDIDSSTCCLLELAFPNAYIPEKCTQASQALRDRCKLAFLQMNMIKRLPEQERQRLIALYSQLTIDASVETL